MRIQRFRPTLATTVRFIVAASRPQAAGARAKSCCSKTLAMTYYRLQYTRMEALVWPLTMATGCAAGTLTDD